VIVAAQFWSKRHALKGISYEAKLSKRMVEIDEPTELVSTVTNESRRLVPFIRMIETLPKGITALNRNVFIRENTFEKDLLTYNSSIYMTPSSRLQRKLKLSSVPILTENHRTHDVRLTLSMISEPLEQKGSEKGSEKQIELQTRAVLVLNLLTVNPNMTRAEIAKALSLSPKMVQVSLNKLVKEDKIKRIESDRLGHWEIIQQM